MDIGQWQAVEETEEEARLQAKTQVSGKYSGATRGPRWAKVSIISSVGQELVRMGPKWEHRLRWHTWSVGQALPPN